MYCEIVQKGPGAWGFALNPAFCAFSDPQLLHCLNALGLVLISPFKSKHLTTAQLKVFVLPISLMSATHTHTRTHRHIYRCVTIVKKITLLYKGTHLPTGLIDSIMTQCFLTFNGSCTSSPSADL